MDSRAWLTPDDAPTTPTCHKVYLPGGLWYNAAFRGAFLLLMDPENWEKLGAQDIETCAAAFAEAFALTMQAWEETCE